MSLAGLATPLQAETPQVIPVPRITSSPELDGDISEWPADGWQRVAMKPAKENDKQNRTGEIEVELQLATDQQHLYVAARWPDPDQSTDYKNWEWKGNRYKRGKRLDDMFALRFHLDGDYHQCMIAEVTYRVDVWLWSAGRSNPAGYANDMWHLVTIDPLENAAEYEVSPGGATVYIRKKNDAGEAIFKNTRPNRKKFQGNTLPGVEQTGNASGSVADVSAKATWQDGYWSLEMRRALDTGHEDDTPIAPGSELRGAIAAFNRTGADHKSISGTLLFQVAAE